MHIIIKSEKNRESWKGKREKGHTQQPWKRGRERIYDQQKKRSIFGEWLTEDHLVARVEWICGYLGHWSNHGTHTATWATDQSTLWIVEPAYEDAYHQTPHLPRIFIPFPPVHHIQTHHLLSMWNPLGQGYHCNSQLNFTSWLWLWTSGSTGFTGSVETVDETAVTTLDLAVHWRIGGKIEVGTDLNGRCNMGFSYEAVGSLAGTIQGLRASMAASLKVQNSNTENK